MTTPMTPPTAPRADQPGPVPPSAPPLGAVWPGGGPAPHAAQGLAFTAPAASGGAPPAAQMWHTQPLGYAPPQRHGLAIAAVVMAALALMGVIAMGVFMFAQGSAGPSWVLQGSIEATSSEVSGQALARELTVLVEDDGGFVGEISCPASSPVGQGEVTVCHGEVDGWEWTGIVIFEDSGGAFTLSQY